MFFKVQFGWMPWNLRALHVKICFHQGIEESMRIGHEDVLTKSAGFERQQMLG